MGLSHIDSIRRRRSREGRGRLGYIDFWETIENLNTCKLWLGGGKGGVYIFWGDHKKMII